MDYNRKKFIVFSLLLTVAVLVVPIVVYAQANNMLWGGQEGNLQAATGLGNQDPRILVANIIRVALGFLGVIALILIMYGGFLWMTSGGDPSKVEKAKKVLMGAIIGLIIILLAFGIASFILNLLYTATTGGGPGTPTCTAANVGSCNGCQLCVATPTYHWQASPSCGPTCGFGPPPGSVNCDGNTMNNTPTFTCDASNIICDNAFPASPPGTYTCNAVSCTCQQLGNVGDPCDLVPATAICDPDPTMCMADLNCNNTSCVCEGAPVIDWISPPSGAPGNLITIGGRFFGTTTGSVFFYDGSNFTIPAAFPNTVNPACTDFWSDYQIIVVVPAGTPANSPIRIVRADNQRDDTNNVRGPAVPDFVVNSIVRPGLCRLTPANGVFNTPVTYNGINLLPGTTANFGNTTAFVPALSPNFTGQNNNRLGTAIVPNINTGRTTTYASSTTAVGNALYFQVGALAPLGPAITGFDPVAGASGQYVTIYGRGFGSTQGTKHVYFGASGINEADYNFPAICADGLWRDNQIIVKVPSTPTPANGNFPITISGLPGGDINTNNLSPNTFQVDSSLTKTPGLCRMEPVLGPNNSPVALWGEYFDTFNSDSKVRFQLNHDQTQASGIISWTSSAAVYEVHTTVHQQAVTGPVRIVKGSPESVSNGLIFTVGNCQADADCGGTNACCPAGTFASGRCVTALAQCFPVIPNSVFEWDFSTAIGSSTNGIGTSCDNDNNPANGCGLQFSCAPGLDCDLNTCLCQLSPSLFSCAGFGPGQCALNNQFCPNSPGLCSPYPGNQPQTVGSCQDSACANIGACASSCTYNYATNKCSNNAACSLPITVPDINGDDLPASCVLSGSPASGRWQITTTMSCPAGWTRSGSNICVDNSQTCDACASGFNCYDAGGGNGICAVNRDICPAGSVCTAGSCTQLDQSRCECCCRIPNASEDCCAPLSCEGTCGNDTTGTVYGRCTGCANAGTTQADHDNACNCTGHSGKYCDTSVPSGVCRDCTDLSGAQCNLHSGQCCIDGKNSQVCRGGNGNILTAPFAGFCAYYNCQAPPTNNQCDLTASTTGKYLDLASCIGPGGCASNTPPFPLLGKSCAGVSTTTCATSFCTNPFSCLDPFGAGPTPGNCGVCCCDPANAGSCSGMSNPNLVCQPDKAPCSGAGRGLCCGCGADTDCVATGTPATTVGCGSDVCCHGRPNVTAIAPADNTINICRNTIMTAEFDSQMDISSFTSNIILVGDYGIDPCPANTRYLSLDNTQPPPRSFARRFWYGTKELGKRLIASIWPAETARAYTPPDASHIYCAVSGTATGYQNVAGNSVMNFKPLSLLDPSRLYYLVILGDKNLDSKGGVMNFWRIGMNGPADSNNVFNGIAYDNSYIWSFTTMTDQGSRGNACQLDHISVLPDSYLFQTNVNDTKDDNALDIRTYDTIRDSDKVFYAFALSSDNQLLNPLPGIYDWAWSWSSSNNTVAANIGAVNTDESLVRASQNVVDGRTTITASVQITADTVFTPSTVGQNIAGQAEAYVFICDNPWPPVANNGTWSPWYDRPNNCTIVDGGCFNTNYELYYCRDAGADGTQDDLPAILSGSTVIRGQSTVKNLLKEAYYFRSPTPGAITPNITLLDIGNRTVQAGWTQITGTLGYKLYWGTATGTYSGSADIRPNSLVTQIVDRLAYGRLYFFNLTTYNVDGAESVIDPLNERTIALVIPAPANLQAVAQTRQATLTWTAVDGAVDYEVASGLSATAIGSAQRVGLNPTVIVNNLISGRPYYFVVRAIDGTGHKSADSNIASATPL